MNAHTPAPLWAAARRPARFDRRRRPGFTTRAAFTLLEMLVALAITMLMMGAAVTLFQRITDSVSGSRAIIEVAERLRATRNRLQADLVGATATMAPPLRPESDEGYFEYIEGQYTDFNNVVMNNTSPVLSTAASLFGDTDDVLMFTVRSRGEPFVGKLNGATIESQVAEVIYFLAPSRDSFGNPTGPVVDATVLDPTTVDAMGNPSPLRLLTLYRRVLLVAPNVTLPVAVGTVFDLCDVSVRISVTTSGPPQWTFGATPNSLGDLTKRENRFAHYGTTFATFPFSVVAPYAAMSPVPPPANNWNEVQNSPNFPSSNGFLGPLSNYTAVVPRLGDDVLMTNVLAFDVQVWDPGAPVFNSAAATNPSVAIEPRDTGYRNALTTWINNSYSTPSTSDGSPPISFGAYADLTYGIFPNPSGGLPATINYPLGATWPPGSWSATTPKSVFSLMPTTSSGWAAATTSVPTPYSVSAASDAVPYALYDTWSLHYENDGINQPAVLHLIDSGAFPAASFTTPDNGTNGIDDDGNGVVDDQLEYDTLPPYQAPLRGIRVVIRVYEPSSQQVREVTVVQDFLAD